MLLHACASISDQITTRRECYYNYLAQRMRQRHGHLGTSDVPFIAHIWSLKQTTNVIPDVWLLIQVTMFKKNICFRYKIDGRQKSGRRAVTRSVPIKTTEANIALSVNPCEKLQFYLDYTLVMYRRQREYSPLWLVHFYYIFTLWIKPYLFYGGNRETTTVLYVRYKKNIVLYLFLCNCRKVQMTDKSVG